jgi:hypothetical protein
VTDSGSVFSEVVARSTKSSITVAVLVKLAYFVRRR